MKKTAAFVLLSLFLTQGCGSREKDDSSNLAASKHSSKWEYLDNGVLKIGIDLNRGAGIGFLALKQNNKNVLNSYDEGRFIQQSFYGDYLGGVWKKNNNVQVQWPWNPVQGGGYQGGEFKGEVTDFKNDGKHLYAKIIPRDWSTGKKLNVTMEQWIYLMGDYVKVHMKFVNQDHNNTRAAHQELPAVFLDAAFHDMVFYSGAKPWQNDGLKRVGSPAGNNQYAKITENWAAFVNGQNYGVGVYAPGVLDVTYYRVTPVKQHGPESANTSYFAPIKTMKIPQNFVYEYDFYIKIGKLNEIRSTFYKIKNGN